MAATLVAVPGFAMRAGAQARPVDVELRGHERTVRLDTLASWSSVPARPAATYAAARAVLEALEMPLSRRDSAGGLLFMEPFNTSRRVIRKPMSWALYCGDGMQGPNADSFRIHMTYALFVEPTVDGQSRLGVAIAAGANNTDGAFRSAIACGSTGAFENELAMLIRARVQLP